MSFSSKVKFEIAGVYGANRHCHIAELSAFINFAAIIAGTDGRYRIIVHSENELVILKFIRLVHMLFNGCECQKVFLGSGVLKEAVIADSAAAEKILQSAGMLESDGGPPMKRVNGLLLKSDCCKMSYVRGAFLCSGSVNDPESSYHIEFACGNADLADDLCGVINSFGLVSKVVERKGSHVVYLKEADQVADILNIIGSHVSLLEYESARVTKQMSNNINRRVNFSSANDERLIGAAVKQTGSIKSIDEYVGLSALSPPLRELAELRLAYPELSLKELGEKLHPPIGKSGVNHRLRKIRAFAEKTKIQEELHHDGESN
jgi:DNA-binding protein WhiA